MLKVSGKSIALLGVTVPVVAALGWWIHSSDQVACLINVHAREVSGLRNEARLWSDEAQNCFLSPKRDSFRMPNGSKCNRNADPCQVVSGRARRFPACTFPFSDRASCFADEEFSSMQVLAGLSILSQDHPANDTLELRLTWLRAQEPRVVVLVSALPKDKCKVDFMRLNGSGEFPSNRVLGVKTNVLEKSRCDSIWITASELLQKESKISNNDENESYYGLLLELRRRNTYLTTFQKQAFINRSNDQNVKALRDFIDFLFTTSGYTERGGIRPGPKENPGKYLDDITP